jgi:hypothetical protein
MKFIGFTSIDMLKARDTCGIEGLFFTTMPCAKGDEWEGMKETDTHITACLRVRKTVVKLGPRGGETMVHGPYAQKVLGKMTNAVTWEGHYTFLRTLFDIQPHGVVKSSVATYRNIGEFLFFATQTKDHNYFRGRS